MTPKSAKSSSKSPVVDSDKLKRTKVWGETKT
jgi:hypothetical protein